MVCYDSSNVLGGGYHMRCKNKIRTLQMGMLTGLMAFAIPVLTGAEDAAEQVDIEELFYTYSNDTQVYDVTDPAYLQGRLS